MCGAADWEGRETRQTEEKKNESSHCNNCSGSIIPTLEQIMLICVSMQPGRELLKCGITMDVIPSDACASATVFFI